VNAVPAVAGLAAGSCECDAAATPANPAGEVEPDEEPRWGVSAGTVPNVPGTACSLAGCAGATMTGTEAKEPVRGSVVCGADGTAVRAEVKTGDGGAGCADGGAGSSSGRSGVEGGRATESSGGAGRSETGFGTGNLARSADGGGAARCSTGGFRRPGATAGTDSAAGTNNCIAVYRGVCDPVGEGS
jgi:hypothetical protein